MKNAKVLQNCNRGNEQGGHKVSGKISYGSVFEHVSCCNLSETE